MARNLLLLVSVLIWATVESNPQKTLYASAPEERGAYYVKGRSVYNYGYNTGDGIAKVEARHPDGSVTGSYRYFDPLGRQIVRSYIADRKGFRVLGNALPVGPETPALGVVPEETLYGTAEGTGDSSDSNHHTSTFLHRNSVGAASTRVETRARPESRLPVQKRNSDYHSRLIEKQEELIRKHQEELDRLRAETNRLYRESNSVSGHHVTRHSGPESSSTRFAPGGYYSTVDDRSDPLRGIYFYHNNKRNYDFPAGFRFADPSRYTRSQGSPDLLQFSNRRTGGIRF